MLSQISIPNSVHSVPTTCNVKSLNKCDFKLVKNSAYKSINNSQIKIANNTNDKK